MSRPEHNYSSDLQYLVVSMVTGRGKDGTAHPISEQKVASFAGAPSERTIRTWKQRETDPIDESLPPPKRGRQEILSAAEASIFRWMGGLGAAQEQNRDNCVIKKLFKGMPTCALKRCYIW